MEQVVQAPVRVGVNLLWLVPGVVGGSEEYTTRLLAGIAERRSPGVRLTLFALAPFARAYPSLVDAFPTVLIGLDGGSKALRVGAESTWLARRCRRAGVDIVHHAGGTMPVVRSVAGVLTVHDLQPLFLPDNFGVAKNLYLRRRLGPSVHEAALVTTISEYTRRSLVERLGADPLKVEVVPPTADPVDGADPRRTGAAATRVRGLPPELRRPFFLYPAVTYPHKNHLVLVRAFARVAAVRDVQLVLTGGVARMEGIVRFVAAQLGVGDRVRRLGRIPRAELDDLYRAATALVFPSRFEGFGIPVLEAMSRGCPVIAADVTALPEVVGGAGVLVSPDDPEAWARAMIDLLDHPGLGERLRAAGLARAADFDSAASVDKLVAVYRRAARIAGERR